MAEFVRTGQPQRTVGGLLHRKDERAAVGAASAPGIPILVGDRAESLVFGGQALQGGVDGLLFRADQADLHLVVLHRKDLRPQHGGIGNADQLELIVVHIVAGDDEEPGAVRRGVDMVLLDRPVDLLLLGGEAVEIMLGGGRHGLDDVLQRIPEIPVPEIEQLDGNLGIREELRIDVVLPQVLGDRIVVGEIAVVHQRFIHADEGMGAAGMPDAPFGGIPLVGDPAVGLEIVQQIILGDQLRVTHDLQDHQIPAMGQDKGLFLAQRGIELVVQTKRILVDELIFGAARVQLLQVCFR